MDELALIAEFYELVEFECYFSILISDRYVECPSTYRIIRLTRELDNEGCKSNISRLPLKDFVGAFYSVLVCRIAAIRSLYLQVASDVDSSVAIGERIAIDHKDCDLFALSEAVDFGESRDRVFRRVPFLFPVLVGDDQEPGGESVLTKYGSSHWPILSGLALNTSAKKPVSGACALSLSLRPLSVNDFRASATSLGFGF